MSITQFCTLIAMLFLSQHTTPQGAFVIAAVWIAAGAVFWILDKLLKHRSFNATRVLPIRRR